MYWHDEPVSKPYRCCLCGNGAESKATYGPFLVTDWIYEETAGAQYIDKLSEGNYRFTLCAMCVRSMVECEGTPFFGLVGEKAPDPVIAAIDTIGTDERADIKLALLEALQAYDDRKNKEKMAKARAARGKK